MESNRHSSPIIVQFSPKNFQFKIITMMILIVMMVITTITTTSTTMVNAQQLSVNYNNPSSSSSSSNVANIIFHRIKHGKIYEWKTMCLVLWNDKYSSIRPAHRHTHTTLPLAANQTNQSIINVINVMFNSQKSIFIVLHIYGQHLVCQKWIILHIDLHKIQFQSRFCLFFPQWNTLQSSVCVSCDHNEFKKFTNGQFFSVWSLSWWSQKKNSGNNDDESNAQKKCVTRLTEHFLLSFWAGNFFFVFIQWQWSIYNNDSLYS